MVVKVYKREENEIKTEVEDADDYKGRIIL